MRLNRRNFLGAATAALLPGPGRADPAPAKAPVFTKDGFRILPAAKTTAALVPAPAAKTELFGFGGQNPGPLLRYKLGDEVRISLANGLDQPVSFACEGLRLPNGMDGVAGLTQKPVPPGGSFDYSFTPPDSGFAWYRSDVPAFAATQIDHGLYGPLIVDESQPPTVDRDIPILIADWRLNAAQQIDTSPTAAPSDHYVVTVNGEATPLAIDVLPGARLRLRLLSLVQSQLVFLAFTGLKPMVVAIDGQPCEIFEPLRLTLPVGPGACFDLICDLPIDSGMQASLAWRTGERNDRPLVIFNTRGPRRPALPPITPLPQNPLLPVKIPLQQSKKANLTIETKGKDAQGLLPSERHGPVTLNGKPAQDFTETPLFVVRHGTPVTLAFVNKTALLLQFYVHGHAMRLLHDLDDGWEPYWRSRVIVPEARVKHAAFIADVRGKWAIECQTLEATPARLVAWFEVV